MPESPHCPRSFNRLTNMLASSYDLGACVYNWGFTVLGGRRHDAFRRRVVELAALGGDEEVLDAGCGTGLTTLRIAARYPGCRLHAIDLSPKMIEVLSNGAAERNLEVDAHVGSITDLPYPDAAFDVVLTSIMFQHLDLTQKQRAVAEIARVLRGPEPARGIAGSRYVSAEFGPRARNRLERGVAQGEYTLYPSHLAGAGLVLEHEELGPFPMGLHVCYRVAVKGGRAAPASQEEVRR